MSRSEQLFGEASKILVGGVNSPVRACKAVGMNPLFIARSEGPFLFSEDGQRYIDYVGAFGPHILGHAHPTIIKAIQEAAHLGTSFGACSALETTLAKLIISFFPSIEKIRLVNSGTEACMSAIRLARGFTGRPIILKFNGCYHGHADSLLVAAGSGNLTFGHPDSAGIPESFVQHTAVLEFNDSAGVRAFFQAHGEQVAGVIVEPVCGNMGVVLPEPGFLETLRIQCSAYGALLIFDEVMTGFRSASGSAQADFKITPDLTCLGKVIGGGLPCGAFGGRAEIMDKLSPNGPVYQAGTLSGNPVVAAAGIAALTLLKDQNHYHRLSTNCSRLYTGIQTLLDDEGHRFQLVHWGSLFSLFFTDTPIRNLKDVKTSSLSCFQSYYHKMLEAGIYLAPSQFEANFVSYAHGVSHIDQTVDAIQKALL